MKLYKIRTPNESLTLLASDRKRVLTFIKEDLASTVFTVARIN